MHKHTALSENSSKSSHIGKGVGKIPEQNGHERDNEVSTGNLLRPDDGTSNTGSALSVEILPPTWGPGPPRTLRGAKEIAKYHLGSADKYRRVYTECASGRLPHWREGAQVICCNTLVIDLWKLLQQVCSLLRRRFTAEDVVRCIRLFDLAMQGIRPSQEEITNTLVKAGIIRMGTR